MKNLAYLTLILACFLGAFQPTESRAQATILPNGESCFQATTATSGGPAGTGTGFVGLLGPVTASSGGTNGTYGGVPLTGGSGSNATANITVSGGVVTAVAIVNPGAQYVVGDVLSASPSNIGGVSGFSVSVASVSINQSLAGGTVAYYVPNTLTTKQTWQNSSETILNANPVQLDGNGCAIVYGAGIYRQILKDSLGNTVWDQLTASTNSANPIWVGQAGGTANAITVSTPNFSGVDGSTIYFISLLANTGATTITPSSTGIAIPVTKVSSTGPVALIGGEIPAGTIEGVTYSATANSFQLITPSPLTQVTQSIDYPQGYLTLNSDPLKVVVDSDSLSETSVYYSPFVGNEIPIYNGSSFVPTTFSQLTLSLTSNQSANTAYDACVFLSNGVPTLVIGPAWANSAAGSGSRGTGAGSAQLTRVNGLWVNAVQITAVNGSNVYTVPLQQCTYVGSILIDGTAGQVSAYVSWGQNRKWGVWNAYNQQPISLLVGDPTATWNYATNAWRAADGNSANSALVFTGLPGSANATFVQNLGTGGLNGASARINIGVGVNSTTAPSGTNGTVHFQAPTGSGFAYDNDAIAKYIGTPAFGLQQLYELEISPLGNGNMTSNGTQPNMVMTVQYGG